MNSWAEGFWNLARATSHFEKKRWSSHRLPRSYSSPTKCIPNRIHKRNGHQPDDGRADDDAHGGGRIALVMPGHHDGKHRRRHRGFQHHHAFQFHRGGQESGQQQKQDRQHRDAQQHRRANDAPAGLGVKFVQMIGHNRADEHERHRDRALSQPVNAGEQRRGQVRVQAERVEHERQHNGDERRVEDATPALAKAAAGQRPHPQRPQRRLHAHHDEEQHSGRGFVEEQQGQRQRNVAVVVNAHAHGKRPRGGSLPQSVQRTGRQREDDAQRHRAETKRRSEQQIADLGQAPDCRGRSRGSGTAAARSRSRAAGSCPPPR